MKNDQTAGKLARMTETISASLEGVCGEAMGDYALSSACDGQKARRISGLWKVTEHTVGGVPFAERFAAERFSGARYANLVYESSFTFLRGMCAKRVVLYADLDGYEGQPIVGYDYRMSLVFAFELRGNSIHVLPVLGYQYSSLDGKPGAVSELPRATEWLSFGIEFAEGEIVLTDGDDVKTLERVGS